MDPLPQRKFRRPSWAALTWVVVVVLAVTTGALLASRSDSGNTDVGTAAELPPATSVPLATELQQLWSADAAVDDQRAVAGATVITSNSHGVRGLDARTGEERWHYQRSTATMCDFTVLDDAVVAIFRTTGRCNEAVALEADTGVRRWYRNVGFSDHLRLFSSGNAVMAATPDGIAILDAVGDGIRWRYNPPVGCELASIAIGTSGVVALESCETGTTWLAEFELYSGDQQWRVSPPAGEVTVLGADGVVSLLVGQKLLILDGRTGAQRSALTVDAGASGSTLFAGQPGGRGVPLITVGARLYAIDPADGALLWSVATIGAPASSDFGIVIPEAGAFVSRRLLTGEEVARTPIPGQPGLEGLLRIERAGSEVIAVIGGGVVAYG